MFFFSESSAGQIKPDGIQLYLPGYNLGCQDKSAEL